MNITWHELPIFAPVAIACWLAGALAALWHKQRTAMVLTLCGTLVFALFIAGLWTSLQRPPLRTMGETRLWYSFFMSLAGLITYRLKNYRWILLFSTLMSTVFIVINLLKPELHDQSLMPALQSVWFIPHVTVYMFSYSVLGCAFLLAVAGLCRHRSSLLSITDSLVSTGLVCLTAGMLTGAIWAKQAWGDYWNWDPKETWAAITWAGYLAYVHLRLRHSTSPKVLYLLLIISFAALQMCWYGVNLLPGASSSVHSYN